MDYVGGLKTLAERSPLFAGRDVTVVMIANPVAGGFAIKKRAARNEGYLLDALDLVRDRPVLAKSAKATLLETRSANHAGELAREVFSAAIADKNPDAFYLVAIAGGDGTFLDAQTAYANMYFRERREILPERVCCLRLPFGTGNDGSDGRTLDQSLRLLTGESRLARQCAVRVHTAQGDETAQWYSFNIASVGIDAYVTHMTNRLKGIIPGDFYKICVDVACLFYGMAYTVGKMTAVLTNRDGLSILNQSGRFVLILMGASGRRTYGSNQAILPDDNNVCAVREMPLLRKLRIKGGFKSGAHVNYPETILCKADKMTLYYGERILLQLDGEARLLYPADFPLTMELTEPFMTVIKAR